MDHRPALDAMRTAARALTVGDVREKLHAVQAAQDALDAAKSVLLAELSASGDFELDGASTLNTWVRNQLRLTPARPARWSATSRHFATCPLWARRRWPVRSAPPTYACSPTA